MTTFELSVRFFLQLAAILVVCRMVGWVATRLGQPPVVGEMIAGVMLGPSLFGYVWPAQQLAFFPPASRPILFSGAQLGLALYMFTVGLDFRFDLMKARLRSAVAISLSGIIAPFALGCGIAWLLLARGGFFPPTVTAAQAVPYMGAAMAITAFPMLARIIFERGLSGTTVGALALAPGRSTTRRRGACWRWCSRVWRTMPRSRRGRSWGARFSWGYFSPWASGFCAPS